MKNKMKRLFTLLTLILSITFNVSSIYAATYTSVAKPEKIDTFPKSYLTFIKTNNIKVEMSNCTIWDRTNPSYEQIIYNPGVREQETSKTRRTFCYNITPQTRIVKTYTHGAKYKGNIINFRVIFFDFQPMSESDIALHQNFPGQILYIAGAIPSFGVFNENSTENFPENMTQYSQMIYSFKVKYEFYDDSNKPVAINKGYMLIGGHNMYEWTADVENISNVYVSNNTIMSNTFTYDASKTSAQNITETFNSGMTKYNRWLTAGYENWQGKGNAGYILYEIKDGVSNFTLAIGKDFEAYLTMETMPMTMDPINFHTLTINYLEEGTNKVLASKYGPTGFEVGKSYNVPSQETITVGDKSYKIVDSKQKNITGTMPDEDVVVNVYYKEVKTNKLTINYLEEGTNKVLKARYGPTVVEKGKTYDVTSQEIIKVDDKTYKIVDSKQLRVTGTMPDKDVVVNVYYKEVKTNKLTINYLEEGTDKVLAPKYGPTVVEKDKTYDVASKETITVENKTYKIVNANQLRVTGKMPDEDVNINVYYKPVYKIITEVVNGTIDPDQVAESGSDVTINYKPKKGFELTYIEIDNEKIKIDDFMKNYPFKNITADHKIKVVFGKEIIVNPPTGDILFIIMLLVGIGALSFGSYMLFKNKKVNNN